MNRLRNLMATSSPQPSRFFKFSNIIRFICFFALLSTGFKVNAQATVLVAGDIVFSDYDDSPAVGAEP